MPATAQLTGQHAGAPVQDPQGAAYPGRQAAASPPDQQGQPRTASRLAEA
ncbi:MAG TPA: hypothetical protein VE464_01915 [Streptosporangiaceae bacterium]|nr:hypothetical protein [Streptosporangiaceae bacterium]